MKITSMQKMIAVAVALLVVMALAVVLLVMPMFQQIETKALERTGAESERALAKSELARLESTKSRSAATQADMLKIGTQMPDSPQLPTLIMEMQDIANASGVAVTSFSPSVPTPAAGGQYTEISMSTQLTAEWADLLDYLHKIDKTTRLLRVTNITVNPTAAAVTTATAGEEVQLTVSLTTKAYVMGANGVIGAAATGK